MARYKRNIVAVRGDTQGGHSGGLIDPETEFPDIDLDDAGQRVIKGFSRPKLNGVQERMWAWHETDRNEIRRLAGKDPITFVEMGDLTQGTIFKDNLAEAQLDRQIIIAWYTMAPWLRMQQVKKVRMAKGTGSHVWGDGASETVLSKWLADSYPKVDTQVAHHWLLEVDGYRIDVAHHGSGPGERNWTSGNVFGLMMKSDIRDALDRNEQPANLYLRAHYHKFTYGQAYHQVDEKIYKAEGYIIPPFCFIGAHAQKAVKSPARMTIGLLAFEIIDGRLLGLHTFLHKIDLRTLEIT